MKETTIKKGAGGSCSCFVQTTRKSRCVYTVIGSHKAQPYTCLQCGRQINPIEEEKYSAKEETNVLTDEGFFKLFNVLEKEKTTLNTLEIEHGPSEWRDQTKDPRKYHLAFVEQYKTALADLTKIPAAELTKTLFEDLSTMGETLGGKSLYVALSRNSPQLISIVRSLLVYGFEKVQSEEQMKFTSKSDVIMFKLDLAQDADFIDIE
eukprot:TRINITY_DN3307_c0_g2_i15.p2 TRINITY_DN3307_c0_g2~~TRINITY_DN3307_c0_g2_i15.p2  ORF type:complete len:207 (+),score=63.67 TRINITY_DN3307_c0_g2_i15:189-809(+)